MTTEEQIGNFTEYFQSQVGLLAELAGDPSDYAARTLDGADRRTHVRALVTTMLDGLAGIRFPQSRYPKLNKRNRERFVRFVADYGNWPEGVLVSVPVLARRMGNARQAGSRLMNHLSSILARHRTDRGNSLPLTEFDQTISDLRAFAENQHEEQLIERSQHLSLLYTYRNFLLHEYRTPGYGAGTMCEDPRQPCYHGYIGEPEWRLAYPVGFFLTLATDAISNLREFLLSGPYDPYERFESSDEW